MQKVQVQTALPTTNPDTVTPTGGVPGTVLVPACSQIRLLGFASSGTFTMRPYWWHADLAKWIPLLGDGGATPLGQADATCDDTTPKFGGISDSIWTGLGFAAYFIVFKTSGAGVVGNSGNVYLDALPNQFK